MLDVIFPFCLIVTGIFSLMIIGVTLRSAIAKKPTGRYWIALNAIVSIWSFCWCCGAFIMQAADWRWFFMYIANLVAIGLPLTFLGFVKSFLDEYEALDRLMKGAFVLSGLLFLSASIFPRWFVADMQFLGRTSLPVGGPLLWLFAFQYLAFAAIGATLLIRAIAQQRGATRNKTLYVFIGCTIGLIGGFTTFVPALKLTNLYPFGVAFPPIYSILITYAIVKHRLMDINVIIRRTLVYSTVMGTLTLIYLVVVALFTRVFEGLTGYQTVFSSAIAACLITVFFQPLRKKVQTFVDAKFFRQYVDREEKLYELSREVITHTTPEEMADALVRVLGETLHPKSAAIYLRARDSNEFIRMSQTADSMMPDRLPELNSLTNYFLDHPQPFIQDLPAGAAESLSTRRPERRSEAA